jgi:hypothetical protein
LASDASTVVVAEQPLTSSLSIPTLASGTILRFSVVPIPNANGDAQRMQFTLTDSEGGVTADSVTVDFQPLNDRPVIAGSGVPDTAVWVETDTSTAAQDSRLFSQAFTSETLIYGNVLRFQNFAPDTSLSVSDVDVGLNQMVLTVKIVGQDSGVSTGNLSYPGVSLDPGSYTVISNTAGDISIAATLTVINSIIAELQYDTTGVQGAPGNVYIQMSVDDQGATGMCMGGKYDTCALTTQVNYTVPMNNAASAGVSAGTVSVFAGSSLAAAGAIGFVAYKSLRKSAATQDDVEPWLEDGLDLSVSNPLYQESGNAGSNPLFDGN